MSTPPSKLDQHLDALFSGLDTRADFDVRLMARLRVEADREAMQRTWRARQEHERYLKARSMLRLVTFDTLGIAVLLLVGALGAWRYVTPSLADVLREHGPYVLILVSLLIAFVPLLGMWADENRRSFRLL